MPHTAKPSFPVVLNCFRGNSLETSLFRQKITLSESISEILRKFVFLNKFEKGKIQWKIWICCKQPFLYKAVKRDKYKQKLFFFTKWATYSKIMLSSFLKHFWANSLKTSLLVQNVTISERSSKKLESLYFSIILKMGKSRGIFCFWSNQ